jgi:uncharacterized protein (DUF433 family)/DNA-binding transcriptional MerR regulator
LVLNVASEHNVFGIGAYTVPEAARLLQLPAVSIRRWVGGYAYRNSNRDRMSQPALWRLQHPKYDHHLELGFRDLIELKFVREFLKAGLSIKTIRSCLQETLRIINDPHPFATRRFKSDGKTIFFEQIKDTGEAQLLDLKNRQYALGKIIEQSFKDLDIQDDIVASWRPFRGKQTIVIDPNRSFGQPIAAQSGIPTVVLADAVRAEGSVAAVASLYEVDAKAIRDAVSFEKTLKAA